MDELVNALLNSLRDDNMDYVREKLPEHKQIMQAHDELAARYPDATAALWGALQSEAPEIEKILERCVSYCSIAPDSLRQWGMELLAMTCRSMALQIENRLLEIRKKAAEAAK